MFDQITKAANDATTSIGNNVADAVRGIELGEQFTSTSDQVLDTVLDVNRRVVDFAVTTADRVADQVSVELPFADSLPTPTVAGERYLEFVERAVSVNRDLNQRIVEMIAADHEPITPTKAATRKTTAEKTTARKSTATKSTATKTKAEKAGAKKSTARKTAAKKTASS